MGRAVSNHEPDVSTGHLRCDLVICNVFWGAIASVVRHLDCNLSCTRCGPGDFFQNIGCLGCPNEWLGTSIMVLDVFLNGGD
jgi:hypothetical protein